jgi:hypothetical protein
MAQGPNNARLYLTCFLAHVDGNFVLPVVLVSNAGGTKKCIERYFSLEY